MNKMQRKLLKDCVESICFYKLSQYEQDFLLNIYEPEKLLNLELTKKQNHLLNEINTNLVGMSGS